MREIQKLKSIESISLNNIEIFTYEDKRIVEYKNGARDITGDILKIPTFSTYEEVFQLPDTFDEYTSKRYGFTMKNHYGFKSRYLEGCCVIDKQKSLFFNFVHYIYITEKNIKYTSFGYDVYSDLKVIKDNLEIDEMHAKSILEKVKVKNYDIQEILNNILDEMIFEQNY